MEFGLTELSNIAAKAKHMPDEFINEKGNSVTEAFIVYGTPLLGSDFRKTAYLKAPSVEKQ